MEPGTEGDEEGGSDEERVEDNHDNDDLPNEEIKRLHTNIINVIKEFSTLNKMEQC